MEIIKSTNYSHQGQRDYQEDSCSAGANFLIVCDGVGGHAKGETASRIVVETVEKMIAQSLPEDQDIDTWVVDLVQQAIHNLNAYAQEYEESWGMGTTMALLLKSGQKLYAIHIGDSRIYHFDTVGTIKWQSKDHSLVQELLDAGVITAEQAAEHPKRNVITRSLQAKEDHKTKASIHTIQNVEVDDAILVCSDGVNEAWTDEGLSVLMGSGTDIEEKIDELEKHCAEHSRDNNTAILAQMGIGDTPVVGSKGIVEQSVVVEPDAPVQKKSWRNTVSFLIPFLIVAGWFGWKYIVKEKPQESKAPVVVVNKKESKKSTDNKTNASKRDSKEDELWDKIKNADSLQKYKDYLSLYPQGKYVKKSKNSLAKLDTAAWETASEEHTVKAYKLYLQHFREGAFSEKASMRILTMKSEAALDSIVGDDEREDIDILEDTTDHN